MHLKGAEQNISQKWKTCSYELDLLQCYFPLLLLVVFTHLRGVTAELVRPVPFGGFDYDPL